jgi:hypothetical protein
MDIELTSAIDRMNISKTEMQTVFGSWKSNTYPSAGQFKLDITSDMPPCDGEFTGIVTMCMSIGPEAGHLKYYYVKGIKNKSFNRVVLTTPMSFNQLLTLTIIPSISKGFYTVSMPCDCGNFTFDINDTKLYDFFNM